ELAWRGAGLAPRLNQLLAAGAEAMDARVAVAVGDVELAIRGDREPSRAIERGGAALDRQEIGRAFGRVATVARLVQVAEGEQKCAVEREGAHGMVGIVGAVDDVLVDG